MNIPRITFALLLWLCASVRGNTEIRHFRPNAVDSALYPTQRIQASIAKHLSASKVLSGPYTKTDIESIYPIESKKSDSRYKAQWYQLLNLEPGSSYELRISYAASMPSNFEISLYSVSEVAQLLNLIPDEAPVDELKPKQQENEIIMYARVTSSYAGVSYIPGMEDQPVPYIFVLEKHVLGLPLQAFKLVGVLVVVIAIGLFVVTPRILTSIDAALADSLPYKEE
ncbi:hypothetical protein H4R24_000344 [Coemansia sp. RSA 988]|nr:hypothetical protein H4R24_000344 [Coemansia sp. RSA 988]